MADKKISALTGATTPLAGTEVLPIVQSGATVKVAVSDLTAGRAMSALSLTTATVQAASSAGLALKNSGGTTQLSLGAGGGDNITLSVASSFTDNLIQGTAAKGVNFTANTPATGNTSQLLNDYQEGTWTPTDQSGAGLTLTVGSASYVKAGKMVCVSMDITFPTTANTATFAVSLPFTVQAASWANGTVGYSDITAYSVNYAAGPNASAFNAYVLLSAQTLQNAQFSGKRFIVSFTYRTA
jgi:hypothetical protein